MSIARGFGINGQREMEEDFREAEFISFMKLYRMQKRMEKIKNILTLV